MPVNGNERTYNILITGCNGYIGRLCYGALRQNTSFRLILTDRIVGTDSHNRFGIEHVDNTKDYSIPETDVHVIDLVNEKKKLGELFEKYKIDLVIHLASALENNTIEVIKSNEVINDNVLDLCDKYKSHCIAASSIRMFYGNCITHPIISKIFRRNQDVQCPENERLNSETVLCNNEKTIQLFSKEGWQEALVYVQTKEQLERLCRQISSSNPSITLVAVRFGWCSVKSPYEIERESATDDSCTQTSIILHPDDLQTFVQRLVQCIIEKTILGFHVYTCISENKQRWASLHREKEELDWTPQHLC
ncbi:unnamed protein product [Adineta ricciae]|uniref:NAD-dependent epimerase/dehydratase domain-containing protein n=1 Tax=Adineta ricciae TaxID=249248 RepID=A0A815EYT0_ADIRI|nr:unnamed protein product [Adineta ricciae]